MVLGSALMENFFRVEATYWTSSVSDSPTSIPVGTTSALRSAVKVISGSTGSSVGLYSGNWPRPSVSWMMPVLSSLTEAALTAAAWISSMVLFGNFTQLVWR